MEKDALSPADRALCSALCYGVVQNYALLDYYISCFSTVPPKKLEPKVLDILRLSAYQLVFMNKIPPRAAVSEGVKLCRSLGYARAAGLVNAVLRRISENLGSLPEIKAASHAELLSIKYSCPLPLTEYFISLLGTDEAERLMKSQNEPAPLSIQANTTRVTTEALLKSLISSGVTAEMHPYLPGCILARDTGDLSLLPEFRRGEFYVQDAAARMAVMLASPKRGDRILDVCSAPGGKSFAAAVMTDGQCGIISCDISEKKLTRIQSGAERLGFSGVISTAAQDGRHFVPGWESAFDVVICDVPCSGLGVIRKKPDIRFKPLSEFDALAQIQLDILANASRYVKPGGVLLYSTCTVRTEENEDVVRLFLESNAGFRTEDLTLPGSIPVHDGQARFYPQRDGTDGFFAARMRRIQ